MASSNSEKHTKTCRLRFTGIGAVTTHAGHGRYFDKTRVLSLRMKWTCPIVYEVQAIAAAAAKTTCKNYTDTVYFVIQWARGD